MSTSAVVGTPTHRYRWSILTHNSTSGIRRWNYKSTTPLEFPSWDWKTNSQGRVVLNFPRILADRANDVMVRQPYDGNLGLAVPGCVRTTLT